MDLAEMLSRTNLFDHLDNAGMRTLLSGAQPRRVGKDEWLTHSGDVWPYLFFLCKGEVVAVKESAEGRSLVLATLRTGEVFWGLALFHEAAPMPAGLRAVQESEIVLWPRQMLLPLLLADGSLSWKLAGMVIERVQLASEIVDQLAFQPVAGRLARLLVESAGQGGPVTRDLTLDEMAARIGTTREMVCRFLHRFSDRGLIDITRTEFSVRDRQGLEEMARQGKG
ncbi:MAG: Crp/Fnr family transcriptional regulator [Anaerolineales bacterium]|nr:Crp/Fnr family transcriptional regulator [Anaerolineales bacterium]